MAPEGGSQEQPVLGYDPALGKVALRPIRYRHNPAAPAPRTGKLQSRMHIPDDLPDATDQEGSHDDRTRSRRWRAEGRLRGLEDHRRRAHSLRKATDLGVRQGSQNCQGVHSQGRRTWFSFTLDIRGPGARGSSTPWDVSPERLPACWGRNWRTSSGPTMFGSTRSTTGPP